MTAVEHSRRLKAGLVGLLGVAALTFVLAPERHLACDDAWLTERSPDQAWTLTVCRRPMFFAMPGGSSDAPSWIVLRDAEGAIRGVVHLDMMQLLAELGPAGGTRWGTERVTSRPSGHAVEPCGRADLTLARGSPLAPTCTHRRGSRRYDVGSTVTRGPEPT